MSESQSIFSRISSWFQSGGEEESTETGSSSFAEKTSNWFKLGNGIRDVSIVLSVLAIVGIIVGVLYQQGIGVFHHSGKQRENINIIIQNFFFLSRDESNTFFDLFTCATLIHFTTDRYRIHSQYKRKRFDCLY